METHNFLKPRKQKHQVRQAAFKMPMDTDTAPNSAPTATLLPMGSSVAPSSTNIAIRDSRRFGFHHRQSKNAASTGYRQDSAIDDILNGKYLDLTVIA